MSVTFPMEWEAPVPVWIDSVNIGMDEIAVCDLMDDTPLPSTPKMSSFVTSLTDHFSSSTTFLDVEAIVNDSMELNVKENASSVRTKPPIAPNLSPVKRKSSAKAARRSGRKMKADPFDRDQRRKDKQRGYETSYRKRQKNKRDKDQAEWVQLETQLRKLLTKRTSVVVVNSVENSKAGSINLIRQRYLELLQEERALREANALDYCVLAENQALTFWGGANGKTRGMREKINTFPSLRGCHMFEFSW